jgi:hypothetical protein
LLFALGISAEFGIKMKLIPENILASGPESTQWYGGAVDRSTMTLRINCETSELAAVSKLVGCTSNDPKHWRVSAPDSQGADLDDQVNTILARLTSDLSVWQLLSSKYQVDLFCGLFLERPNRGVTLRADTMTQLGARGISFGFDIYAPD